MNYTNADHFPVPIQNALRNDSYDGGIGTDISATSLKDSPRIPFLRKNNPDLVKEKAKNMILPLMGTALHKLMEENSPSDWVLEERFYTTVETPLGQKVLSGQIDAVVPVEEESAKKFFKKKVEKPCVIYDYKLMHSWKTDTDMKDFEEQGNIYAYLLRKNGYSPISFVIWAFIRDWTNAVGERKDLNPLAPFEFPLWPVDVVEDYIKDRASVHFSNEEPSCSEKDMWLSPSVFEARKKKFSKDGSMELLKTTKLFNSEKEALHWIADGEHRATAGTTVDDWAIAERPRIHRRCEGNYCGVAEICDQFLKTGKLNENRTENI